MSWINLNGKVVIVTGGAGGIGLSVVKGFVEVGARVMIADFSEQEGLEKAEEATRIGPGEAAFSRCDVSSKAEVDELVFATMKKWGSIDVLVNNAGINVPRLLVDPYGKEELTEEIWDKVFEVNVKGQFLCAQAAVRQMLNNEKGGVLINMSSESGLEGSEGQSAYAATKAASQNMTRSWAKELGSQGIRVVGVAPGIMETTGMRSDEYESSLAYTRGISIEDLRSKYAKTTSIPLGRSGKLSEVSDLVVFLASERSSYLHGTTVNLSGGKSRG